MALFGKKESAETKDEAVKAEPKKAPAVDLSRSTDRNLQSVILRPRLTEKSVMAGERNVYTFEVRKDATKYDVRDAVSLVFGVTPVKVNIVNKSARKTQSRSRGRMVTEKGLKKVYVYLKDGDTISVV